EAVEPDHPRLELRPAPPAPGQVGDNHHVVVVGPEDHLRLRLEFAEPRDHVGEDLPRSLGTAVRAAPGEALREHDLPLVGDPGGSARSRRTWNSERVRFTGSPRTVTRCRPRSIRTRPASIVFASVADELRSSSRRRSWARMRPRSSRTENGFVT